MTEITLQYFDGCPNWRTTDMYLIALIAEGHDVRVTYEPIDAHEKAVERGFQGSPTVLVDGVDPFADTNATIGLACRIYQTETGPAGSPSLHQLHQAILTARREV